MVDHLAHAGAVIQVRLSPLKKAQKKHEGESLPALEAAKIQLMENCLVAYIDVDDAAHYQAGEEWSPRP